MLNLQFINNTELAKQIGVTPQCVCQWISGKRQPSIENLPVLAKALHCSIENLVFAIIDARKNLQKRRNKQNEKINN